MRGSEVSPGARRASYRPKEPGVAVGRLYEMVRKGRANPLWPPVGPDRGVIPRK